MPINNRRYISQTRAPKRKDHSHITPTGTCYYCGHTGDIVLFRKSISGYTVCINDDKCIERAWGFPK